MKRTLRAVLLGWVSAELVAVYVLLIVWVAGGPVVVLAVAEKRLGYVPGWAALVAVLSTSVPLALILGRDALRVPAGVARRIRR